jgi:sigma54-dependent transcription regulator
MADIEIVPPKADWRLVINKTLDIGHNLDFEFRRQARLMGRVAFFNASAKRRTRQLKAEIEVLSARLRKQITLREGRRLTKDEMHYAVERKKVYRAKQRELEEAIYQEDLIKGMLNALEHKKDCLVQLGAASRLEMSDELRALRKSR